MMRSGGGDRRPLSELVSGLTTELLTLVRQELQLAKVQMRGQAVMAAKGGAVLVVAALGGLLTLVFGTSAVAWGLAQVMAVGWAFLIITVFWLLVTSVAAVVGGRKLTQIGPPTQMLQSLKEDVQWAKTQTS